jgi:hypothetical protein
MMEPDEYIGTRTTFEDVLAMAEAEGVELGARQGRVTARGSSPVLTALIKEYEREIVEHFGGTYRVPWD